MLLKDAAGILKFQSFDLNFLFVFKNVATQQKLSKLSLFQQLQETKKQYLSVSPF